MTDLVQQTSLGWRAAQEAARAAAEKADELDIRVNVSVVDASGLPLAFLRLNGAPLHSISIAEDKAYTAVSFATGTQALAEAIAAEPRLWDGLAVRERFVLLGGGIPILIGGELVGGIGVSGGTEEEDVLCAEAGMAALGTGAE